MEDRNLSVLVVEDDAPTRETMLMVLEMERYRVSLAANGREAFDLLRDGERPGLILLDLRMPVMDGSQFRRLQQRDAALASVPVLVLSADADVARKAVALGASGYLKKPADPADLLALVHRHCWRGVHASGSPSPPPAEGGGGHHADKRSRESHTAKPQESSVQS